MEERAERAAAQGVVMAAVGLAAGVGLAVLILKALGKPVPALAPAIGGGAPLPSPWPGTNWSDPSTPGTHSIGVTIPAQSGTGEPAYKFPAAYPRA